MVTLKSTNRSRERILAFGMEGAGKTFGWFSIAAKTDGHFYVLDTDNTVEPFLDGERFGELADRVTYHVPWGGWEEYVDFLDKALTDMGPEDWLVVDRVDQVWEEAQQEFSRKIFDQGIDEVWMTYRTAMENDKDKKGGSPFDGFTDWAVIKKLHSRFMVGDSTKPGLIRAPGHVYLTAGEKRVDSKLEKDPNVLRTYSRIGVRPAGNKENGHMVRTVLRFIGNTPETWRLTTVKDRERAQLDAVKVGDFATDYLLKIAGWRPGK
ncbi:MAG: hypothetical protein R3324_11810 [Halobacteriales archaeon]|nr:hypothetical protein [Halobacteriales archaeon]